MTKFHTFKEVDTEGLETLETIAKANRFNEWMYQTISANLNGKTLEIGSGIGNISTYFLRDKRSIHLTDIRKNYINHLNENFKEEQTLTGICQLDLVHPNFDIIYKDLLEQFDGVYALNVIEHIENDTLAVANCYKLLKPEGRLVILVPAYQSLYNGFDSALEHYRRYSTKALLTLIQQNNFVIDKCQHFNFIGIFGWFFSGTILRKKVIPKGQMSLFNKLVPLFKIIDKLMFNKVGLSVIAEGIKK